MTVASMTGYARAEGRDEGSSWVWEARSVNGRSLEVRCRVPPGYDRLDHAARAATAAKLKRGNVSLSLTVAESRSNAPVRINRALLAELQGVMEQVRKETGAAPPTVDGLLRIRGVIESDDAETAAEPLGGEARQASMLQALDAALDGLALARAAEGARLGKLLEQHLATIDSLRRRAEERASEQEDAIRRRFDDQLSEILGRVPALSQERLAQEIALLVTKADVREELDRLAAHIQQAGDLLRDAGPDKPIGRKFDFLCQEFNREANTVCSKSSDIELTRIGIELKSAIEQMREQVQNVE